MTFPVPKLDNRTFQELVDGAKRLIPQYAPEWTDHNLSDPGVTLIELFAWMVDQMLYQLNEVPDALYSRFLNLLDMSPFQAVAATTQIRFLLAAPNGAGVVPADTEVATRSTPDHPAVQFLTERDLVLRQPGLVDCLTRNGATGVMSNVWAHLSDPTEAIATFGEGPVHVADALILGFETSLGSNLIELQVKSARAGVGASPQAPPIRWQASLGPFRWADLDVELDTTHGLNETGVVTFVAPSQHARAKIHGQDLYWIRAVVTPGAPAFIQSPEILTVTARSLGGDVAAVEGRVVPASSLGTSNGNPGQHFDVPLRPVLDPTDTEGVTVTPPDGPPELWTRVLDFSYSSSTSRDYTWNLDSGRVAFGPCVRDADGNAQQFGLTPAKGATISTTEYRTGGGTIGNVGAGTVTVLKSSLPFISGISNPSPACGGLDAESIEQAKVRVPLTLATGDRAVTAADYERIALDTDRSIERARCVPPTTRDDPVLLYLVTSYEGPVPIDGPIDPCYFYNAPTGGWDALRESIDKKRMIGSVIELAWPQYQGVAVQVTVYAHAQHDPELVRRNCETALYSWINPFTGGDNGTGWPWGTPLTAEMIRILLGRQDGVTSIGGIVIANASLDTDYVMPEAITELPSLQTKPDALLASAHHIVDVVLDSSS